MTIKYDKLFHACGIQDRKKMVLALHAKNNGEETMTFAEESLEIKILKEKLEQAENEASHFRR